jgi:4-hydroxy 2-oxovalerate aldolase
MIKILDCTFRDGGYYNNWDFDRSIVQKYLHVMNRVDVNIIELGFRNFPQDKFLGAFAYTTDIYINSLKISNNILVCVMIDANSILNSNYSVNKAINILFQSKKESRVDLVRIATSLINIEKCFEIAKILKQLGYKVSLNIMQVHSQSEVELSKISKLVQNVQLIDVLYFADSLGCMEGSDVIRVASSLSSNWSGDIGFHAHNNKGLAMSNILVAIDNGVTWVDSTVLGMGRGAGNAQTESLLLELHKKHQTDYSFGVLFDLVLSDFLPLKNYYCWGESLLYNLAAINNIHPTYIQEMLIDNRYSNKEILQAIDFMSEIDATHYDEDLFLHARNNINNKGSWNAKNWCIDKEVLILGSGEGQQIYKEDIIQYIKKYQPVVISINIQTKFPSELVDVYVSSNESKMIVEHNLYKNLTKPLVISEILLKNTLNNNDVIEITELWDYGLNITPGVFEVREKECTLPYELSIGYALSLACIGKANSISLVGFDGYGIDDNRQTKMIELFNLFKEVSIQTITTLTPSTYNISQSSIYANKL